MNLVILSRFLMYGLKNKVALVHFRHFDRLQYLCPVLSNIPSLRKIQIAQFKKMKC